MPLNEDIVEIEKPDGICSLNFIMHGCCQDYFYGHQSFQCYSS